MMNISKSVTRKDHYAKITGREKYVGDYSHTEDGNVILVGRFVRSNVAHAEIRQVFVPELPDGYYYIDGKDAPRNVCVVDLNDSALFISPEQAEQLKYSVPLFAEHFIEYAGQPVGMIVGPDEATVRQLVSQCRIDCRELPAVIHLKDAEESLINYERELGHWKEAFEDADTVYEETFSTGHQYQAYLETQGIMVEPEPDGRLLVHGAMQCPYAVREKICYALDCDLNQIHIRQDAIGGAFGGKEDFPYLFGPQVAVAAKKTGKAVRVLLDRREDLQFNFKRHPSVVRIRAAVKDGMVTAMDIDGKLDNGAFIVVSGDVAMRYFATFPGVYSIPNLHVTVELMKTNTPPTGSFRGFGGPQSIFATEMAMSHIAEALHVDDLSFKMRHMARKGSCTPTGGGYSFDVPLPEMIAMAEASTSYSKKKVQYSTIKDGVLKHGIGIALGLHGCPLCAGVEWKFNPPRIRLRKAEDGTVEVFTGQTDLGQGIRTAYSKIVSEILEIPYNQVSTPYPDSDYAEDTGMTAASRSVVCVGKAVADAAYQLKQIWKDGTEQEVTAQYKRPKPYIDFDDATMTGVRYDDFSWSVVVVEVLVDTLSGNVKIENVHGVYNCGTPIDENILRSQMEGGLLQAIGYSASERLVIGNNGKMFNTAFADYHIPTATDVPSLSVEFETSVYSEGPFGAKGAGELPLVGVASAYLSAVEQAIGKVCPVKLNHIPFVPEDVINVINREE